MKRLSPLLLIATMFASSVLADDLELADKNLRVGTQENPGQFSLCAISAAMEQVLKNSHRLSVVAYSEVDYNEKIQKTARLHFIVEEKNTEKTLKILKLVLTSLDPSQGWQLAQDSTGEIYPYTSRISVEAKLMVNEHLFLGTVDLKSCR